MSQFLDFHQSLKNKLRSTDATISLHGNNNSSTTDHMQYPSLFQEDSWKLFLWEGGLIFHMVVLNKMHELLPPKGNMSLIDHPFHTMSKASMHSGFRFPNQATTPGTDGETYTVQLSICSYHITKILADRYHMALSHSPLTTFYMSTFNF